MEVSTKQTHFHCAFPTHKTTAMFHLKWFSHMGIEQNRKNKKTSKQRLADDYNCGAKTIALILSSWSCHDIHGKWIRHRQ